MNIRETDPNPDQGPRLERIDGALWWRLKGRLLPVFAGGDDGDGDGGKGGDGAGDKGGAGGGDGDGGKGGGSGDDAAAIAADRERRRELQSLRQRMKEVEKERDELKAAQLSDTEKATERATKAEEKATALEKDLRTMRLTAAVDSAAKDLGIRDARAAQRLMDDEAVEWDDDGKPKAKSVAKALADAAKEHPILVKSGPGDGGGGSGGSGNKGDIDMNALIRQKAGMA